MNINSIEPASPSLSYPTQEAKIAKEGSGDEQTLNNNAPKGENIMVSEKTLIKAIEKANKVTINHSTRAEFTVHEGTKDIMIKIIDTESNEVVREFPPKKFLDLIAKLWEMAGIVVDERR